MKKIKYIILFLAGFTFFSCEVEYDLEIDMSDTANAFLVITNDAATVSETKSIELNLKTYIPYWEDVTINWTVSGSGFTSFSGSGVWPKMTGETGSSTNSIVVDIPATVVPTGELSTEGVLTFECTTASGKVIEAGQNGDKGDLAITINKYIPLDRSVFIGTHTENDTSDDYTGVVVKEDPDDEFGFIIETKTWGSGGSYKVVFNTVTEKVSCLSQYIGMDYPGVPGSNPTNKNAIWFSPATDASMVGSFDISTGNFTVPVNMALKYYPHNFGDNMFTYTKD